MAAARPHRPSTYLAPAASRTAALLATACATLLGATPAAAEAPLRAVTLYTSGVGLMVHAGEADEEGDVRLHVRRDRVADVLKSLTLLSSSQRVQVRYSGAVPDQRDRFDLSRMRDTATLADVLRLVRGRGVELTLDGGETLVATVLAVSEPEPPQSGGSDGDAEGARSAEITLAVGSGIRGVPVASVRGFTFTDPEAARELADSLEESRVTAAEDRVTLQIDTDAASDDIRLAYTVGMPTWKPSYRLTLPERDGLQRSPLSLKGWAVVDNATDQDWDQVTLTLTSGRPVSFGMDLFSPRPVERPVLAQTDTSVSAPEVARQRMFRSAIASDAVLAESRAMEPAAIPQLAAGAGAGTVAEGAAGGVSTFAIEGPVDVAAGESVMVPLLSQELQGRRLSLLNPDGGQGDALPGGGFRPVRALELTNTADVRLEGGPVTVLGGGATLAFAGDARFDSLGAGQTQLLPFALDQDLTVEQTQNSRNTVVGGSLSGGVLLLERRVIQTRTLEASNSGGEPRTLLIELNDPAPGFEPGADAPDPVERVPGAQRYALEVPAGGEATLSVPMERLTGQRVSLLNQSTETLVAYAAEESLPADLRQQLERLAELQRGRAEAQAQAEAAAAGIQRIRKDQQRIRSNMSALNQTTPLYNQYVVKLTEQEQRLTTLATEEEAAREAAATAEEALLDALQE